MSYPLKELLVAAANDPRVLKTCADLGIDISKYFPVELLCRDTSADFPVLDVEITSYEFLEKNFEHFVDNMGFIETGTRSAVKLFKAEILNILYEVLFK